jgi:RNA polymerase sigma-70 factor (family 1)
MHLHINHTDQELLSSLKAGVRSAFDTIYRGYASDLYRYARKNIPSSEDCEEIIQDVFVSLWERREELNIVSLRHYLFNAVRYKVIRYFQHEKVKKKYAEHFRFFEQVYDTLNKDEPAIENVQSVLMESISDLPERCQIAFRLRLLENLSNSEIAERMNIAKKTVEVYMFKVFSHLRESGYHRIFKTG